jgi:putative transposase
VIQAQLPRCDKTHEARLNLLAFTSPEALRAAMAEFIEFHRRRHYHQAIGKVTPADVYYGRREEILQRRKWQK